jgi:shikimate dehydrogenase
LDGDGFLAGLRSIDRDVIGRRVLLIGAGGAATAIGFAIARAGARSIAVRNRTRARADELGRRLRALGIQTSVVEDACDDYDIVVNASSVGMRDDDPSPIDPAELRSGMVVCDIIVGTRLTPLVRQAQAYGCVVQNGDAMLAGQIRLMARFMLDGSAGAS